LIEKCNLVSISSTFFASFVPIFLSQYFWAKKLQSQNVTREKLRKALSYKKICVFYKMLMKLSPWKCSKQRMIWDIRLSTHYSKIKAIKRFSHSFIRLRPKRREKAIRKKVIDKLREKFWDRDKAATWNSLYPLQ